MIQVDASLFIVLSEILAISVAMVCFLVFTQFRRRGRLKKAVKSLVEQIKQQSKTRTQETGSFLQNTYQLDDSELSQAVSKIDKQEKKFFQALIDVIGFNKTEKITSIDADLAALIDTYKNLAPRIPDAIVQDTEETLAAFEELKAENDSLREELEITKKTMADMIGEFGNMFGGGSDHELAKHEVVEQVKPKDEKPKEGQAAVDDELFN